MIGGFVAAIAAVETNGLHTTRLVWGVVRRQPLGPAHNTAAAAPPYLVSNVTAIRSTKRT